MHDYLSQVDADTALPGASIVELGDWGMRTTAREELDLVASWRDFLNAPQRWLRHLVG